MASTPMDRLGACRARRRTRARILSTARVACLSAAMCGFASAQTVHVDPTLGVDVPGGGAPGSPLKTIAFALTQHVPPQALDLRLHAGVYDAASGEFFPLHLPLDVTVTAVVPRAARVVVNDLFGTAFVIAGGARATLRGLVIEGGGSRCIKAILGAGEHAVVTVDDCHLRGNRQVTVTNEGGLADVTITRSVLEQGDMCVRLEASAGGSIQMEMDHCAVRLGMTGMYAAAHGPSASVFTLVRGTAFSDIGLDGVRSWSDAGGVVSHWFEGCVFHDIGFGFAPPKGTVLKDQVSGAGPAPFHTVINSILFHVAQEMPQFQPAHYLLVTNLVQDPALVGIGGNVTGDPLFTDAGKGDFRLLPGSPAIDAGTTSAATLPVDVDGDPRAGSAPDGFPGTVDIGVDEFYARHMHVHANPVKIGAQSLWRFVGPPGATAWLVISLGTNGAAFASGYRLAAPALPPVAVGVLSGTGTLDVPILVPSLPALIGLTLFEQAVFQVPAVSFGFNVVEQTFQP